MFHLVLNQLHFALEWHQAQLCFFGISGQEVFTHEMDLFGRRSLFIVTCVFLGVVLPSPAIAAENCPAFVALIRFVAHVLVLVLDQRPLTF